MQTDPRGGTMSLSIISLLAGALVGAGLGAIYLGLLWVAVRHLPQDRTGVFVFVGLGLGRLALLLGALAVAAALGPPIEGIAAAVLGFVAMRFAATRLLARATLEDRAWK